jgi:hypothetical protein
MNANVCCNIDCHGGREGGKRGGKEEGERRKDVSTHNIHSCSKPTGFGLHAQRASEINIKEKKD